MYKRQGLELARPYVNRQIYGETFDPSIALKKGTLFPELDLVESNNYNDWLYENPMNRVKSVSYTHLDVYKRQILYLNLIEMKMYYM